MLIFWAAAKLLLAIGLGLGTAGPANFFTLPMLIVLAAQQCVFEARPDEALNLILHPI